MSTGIEARTPDGKTAGAVLIAGELIAGGDDDTTGDCVVNAADDDGDVVERAPDEA